jgi:hypothetical protein
MIANGSENVLRCGWDNLYVAGKTRSFARDIGLDVIAMIGAMIPCMTHFVACRRGRYPIGSWSERAEQAAYSQGMQARTAE